MSCITFLMFWATAPRAVEAVHKETLNTNRVETAVARKNHLSIRWHAVTDAEGRHRLEMRWKRQ